MGCERVAGGLKGEYVCGSCISISDRSESLVPIFRVGRPSRAK